MPNFNFNKVILGGRLTVDPELKQTQTGIPVVSFSVAVNRRSKSQQNQTDFFNVTAWRSTAEFVHKYFHKGSSICLSGSVQNRTWQDQQGQKHYATDIVADEVYFVDSVKESGNAQNRGDQPYTPEAYTATPAFSTPAAGTDTFVEINPEDSSDDLPF